MGLGHHQLRVVGWYRSRRNTDLCDPFTFPPGMENRCEQGSRSDDHLCGNVRRTIPDLAHGSCMECILHTSISKHTWSFVGELQLATAVGRICHLNLLYRITSILVFRSPS